jgi:S1-C subfamily serine protease
MMKLGRVRRAWLGIEDQATVAFLLTDPKRRAIGRRRGVIVLKLAKNSPAASAGIEEKDIIVALAAGEGTDRIPIAISTVGALSDMLTEEEPP